MQLESNGVKIGLTFVMPIGLITYALSLLLYLRKAHRFSHSSNTVLGVLDAQFGKERYMMIKESHRLKR